MIKLYDTGAYLVNGTELVEDSGDAKLILRNMLGKDTLSREEAAENTIAYRILKNHNTSGNKEKLKIKYHKLTTQDNTYDYDGKRISKNDNGAVTNYFYQGEVVLYTTDESENITSHNIIGPQNNIIATIRCENENEHSYFYNKDIRTSVSNIIDENGQAIASYKYGDYGKTTKVGNLNFYNEICYTSGVYDELTGLYYFNSRYYNPDTATFITQDSYRGEIDSYETWNLYAYCGGNPINYVDPSGHFVVAIPLVEYYFISAVVSIVVTKEAIDVVSAKRHKTKEYNPDPYGRKNQKKQGRENKNKNRTHLM